MKMSAMYSVAVMTVLRNMVGSIEIRMGAQLALLICNKVMLRVGMMDGDNSLGLSRGTRLGSCARNDLRRGSRRWRSINGKSNSNSSRSHEEITSSGSGEEGGTER